MSTVWVRVTLFKACGKYYTTEKWRIPTQEEIDTASGRKRTTYPITPACMRYSPDFRRVDGGSVLVETQEPWGHPFLIENEERDIRTLERARGGIRDHIERVQGDDAEGAEAYRTGMGDAVMQRLEEAEEKLKEHKDVIRALRKQRDETDQLIIRVWQFIRDLYGIGSDISDPEQIRSHLRENGYFREQWRRRLRAALHARNGAGEFTESGGLFPSDIDLIVETILDAMNLHDSKDES